MTEEQARLWLQEELGVSRETMERLDAFRLLLLDEAGKQNLISASTLEHVWARHIVDSAQLLKWVQQRDGVASWIDLGSGAGFPGIVIAILRPMFHVKLVESRARRAHYLQDLCERLDLANTAVAGQRLERVETKKMDIISARAFAPLPKLLNLAERFSTENTLWLLPKGRNAAKELQEAQVMPEWRGRLDFDVEPSETDAEAGVLVGHLRAARGSGKQKKR